MNLKENFVITIGRQFGTGGHEIGATIAKQLNVKLIDKQILKALSAKFNVSEQDVAKLERRRPSWWDDFAQFYKGFAEYNEYNGSQQDITSRQVYTAQISAMKEIASRESCVIIGRCGFDAFKDHPNKLSVFLHSGLACRIERICRIYNVTEEKARVMIEDNDYTREVYTKSFTDKNRYDARNYDLALDVSTLGIQGTIDFLLGMLRL